MNLTTRHAGWHTARIYTTRRNRIDMKTQRLHQTRSISFFKYDARGERQLTRIVFEAGIGNIRESYGFVWLAIDDPAVEQMDKIIDKQIKPRLAKKFGGHELTLLLHNLKQDYRKEHVGGKEHDQVESTGQTMTKVFA
jgi:hypothetical protein